MLHVLSHKYLAGWLAGWVYGSITSCRFLSHGTVSFTAVGLEALKCSSEEKGCEPMAVWTEVWLCTS
jgi:hypothetical protein